MARSGIQTGAEAEVEPMPDWERELLGAQADAVPAETTPAPVAPIPADEEPAVVAAEADADAPNEFSR